MKQPVLFGKPEADYFVQLIQEAANQGDKEAAKSYVDEQMKRGRETSKSCWSRLGLGILLPALKGALFGRFVTSDILARVDAPVHVAHAFTTHVLDTEVDFFHGCGRPGGPMKQERPMLMIWSWAGASSTDTW